MPSAAIRSQLPAGLATLVAMLRAVYQVHQGAHWQTRAQTYYADHLLFQKLYEATLPEIDSVAERTIGSGGLALLNPTSQSARTTEFIDAVRGSGAKVPNAHELVAVSLSVENMLLQLIDEVLSLPGVSQGTQNLLQGIADTHEGHIYLLQQRLAQG